MSFPTAMAPMTSASHGFWQRRSLRFQVMVAVIAINLAAALVAFLVVIVNARRATEAEMSSSVAIAERLVEETVDRLAGAEGGSVPLAQLPLHIAGLRHVRIHIEGPSGQVVAMAPLPETDGETDSPSEVPAWFAGLITVDHTGTIIPIIENGERLGAVRVAGEAADEIAEVWSDTRDLVVVAAFVNLAILSALYLVLGRLLRPLRTLSAGLSELEEGRFDHRLPVPNLRELALIADRFNTLGEALRKARDDNCRLNERLVRLQDDERRQIASDLHDELGPCVFGLRANLESVDRLSSGTEATMARRIRERTATMGAILDRVQELNRSLLRRIRPMALDHVPLSAVLTELLADFGRHSPDSRFRLSLENIDEHYDDSIEITIYRCIQEAVTNALRHGKAADVAVILQSDTQAERLCLVITDDGIGVGADSTPGFGFIGIEERVGALGGRWHIAPGEDGGTRLQMTIPIRGRVSDARLSKVIAA